MFSFLIELTVACAVLPWAVICATYLRFRRAVRVHGMEDYIPQEARSPLQPYLAIYGLIMSSILSGTAITVYANLLVIFSGYAVFTRNNAIWSRINNDWGYSIGPWATLAAFCIILFILFARGGWSFGVPSLLNVDVHDGVSKVVADDVRQRSKFEKRLIWLLDKF